jgi:sulfite reductase alpha subunit-like flavoprotein
MIYILYGSQSGNCENISKLLYDILNDGNEPIIYGTLNSILNKIDNISGTMYIICSTFGNGDAPENASAFWRTIKSRKIKNDLFKNINYNVLGLGNSNYSQFCYMGKKIDKRIEELGGKRIKPLICVDEVEGLEEPVELWLDQFRK